MKDSTTTYKEQWYDLAPYRDEIKEFIKGKRAAYDVLSDMEKNYDKLYRSVFAGTEEGDEERFPHLAEMYKVYKSSLIEQDLSGYSALLEVSGDDAYSTLKVPQLKKVMTDQFKSMTLLENITGDTVDDWILKGEAVGLEKLEETKEEYRIRQKVVDETTGEEVISFTVKEGVTYKTLGYDRIDPLDFYVDALDYQKDPKGCTKIIRSFVDASTLLCSNAYPLLSKEDKLAIINSKGNKNGSNNNMNWFRHSEPTDTLPITYNKTDKNQIEVLSFYGDYVTSDNKVLKALKVVLVAGQMAYCDYDQVNTCRIIYAPYKVDRLTHRSISPLMCSLPVNTLMNRVTDLFIQNIEDVSVPIMTYSKGSMTQAQIDDVRTKKQCEYNDINGRPDFWTPPMVAQNGLQLMDLIIDQNKNVLGLNNYMAGDTSGSVRTARESAILSQKANARMRVETDVFSYRFLLPLFVSFYAFNRELALAAGEPLDEIFSDPQLKVSISTNASRADKEGELRRLMEMLNLPISQMIFSNLTPEQVVLAVRYLMAKAELPDADNLLQLVDSEGNQQYPIDEEKQMRMQQMQQQMMNNNNMAQMPQQQ